MRMRPSYALILAAVVITSRLTAQNCSPTLSYRSTTEQVSTIGLQTTSFSNDLQVQQAADFWNQGCASLGFGSGVLPQAGVGACASADCITIDVVLQAGVSTSGT